MKELVEQYYEQLDMWKPLDLFLASHPQFTEFQIRTLLRNRDNNGFKQAICKVGRRIYINEILFAEWMMNQE